MKSEKSVKDSMAPGKKIRIVFLIRSLFFGGAERQLLTLVKGMNRDVFDPYVISYYGGGDMAAEFFRSGIPVIQLNKSGRWDVIPFLFKLVRQISILKPDILHSYLTMSNILAVMIRIFFPNMRIVFGIRSAYFDVSNYDWLTRFVYSLEIRLSRFPELIIVNSNTSKRTHVEEGFPGKRIVVVPNGIDTAQFYPSLQERQEFRSKLGVQPGTAVVGLVARLDSIKDHPTFLKTALEVIKAKKDVKFLCVGDGEPDYQAELEKMSRALNISDAVIWMEGQKNVRAAYNALDICCSTSTGESFSNVIAEAMACGIPCVVTDVGDSALIVGNPSVVAPVADAHALAAAILKILDLPEEERIRLGMSNRQRIEENFTVERMIQHTESALTNLYHGIISE